MSDKSDKTLWICLLMAIVQSSAWQYCSDTETPATCVPCGEKNTHRYKCPKQCGTGRELNLCDSVCSDSCLNSECKYGDDGSLVCLQGCTKSYSGPYCQQLCMDGCVRCTQDGKRCLECEMGRYGETCQQTCDNCKDDTCSMNGTCITGCKPGYYGKQCHVGCDKSTSNCAVCDHTNGTCMGCKDGYHGSKCETQCQVRCTQCHGETGECQRCDVGWYGSYCQQKCQNCKNRKCDLESGRCTDGCAEGFRLQDTTCQKVLTPEPKNEPTKKKDPEEKKAMSGLASIFQNEDYLLPIIGCLLVVMALIAVIVFWRCRKLKPKTEEKGDVEDGICNGLSSHPSLRRSSKDATSTAALYQDIVEEAIRTHSCEEILKKHNLLDPDRTRLSPYGDKSLASLRNRTGNLSMPFMTPIEEDEEEEIEDDGVHMPNVGIIFTLEPPSDDDACDDQASNISKLAGSQDGSLSETPNMVSSDSGSSVNHPGSNPDENVYILQRGARSTPGGRAISFDYLDTSHSSGRSTPRVPDMYLNNPHGEQNQFSTILSNHLDTFLTDRSNTETVDGPGAEIDVYESDALLGTADLQNNNSGVPKSGNPLSNKLKRNSLPRETVVANGDMGIEMDHLSLSSDREPMLSHTSDSNA